MLRAFFLSWSFLFVLAVCGQANAMEYKRRAWASSITNKEDSDNLVKAYLSGTILLTGDLEIQLLSQKPSFFQRDQFYPSPIPDAKRAETGIGELERLTKLAEGDSIPRRTKISGYLLPEEKNYLFMDMAKLLCTGEVGTSKRRYGSVMKYYGLRGARKKQYTPSVHAPKLNELNVICDALSWMATVNPFYDFSLGFEQTGMKENISEIKKNHLIALQKIYEYVQGKAKKASQKVHIILQDGGSGVSARKNKGKAYFKKAAQKAKQKVFTLKKSKKKFKAQKSIPAANFKNAHEDIFKYAHKIELVDAHGEDALSSEDVDKLTYKERFQQLGALEKVRLRITRENGESLLGPVGAKAAFMGMKKLSFSGASLGKSDLQVASLVAPNVYHLSMLDTKIKQKPDSALGPREYRLRQYEGLKEIFDALLTFKSLQILEVSQRLNYSVNDKVGLEMMADFSREMQSIEAKKGNVYVQTPLYSMKELIVHVEKTFESSDYEGIGEGALLFFPGCNKFEVRGLKKLHLDRFVNNLKELEMTKLACYSFPDTQEIVAKKLVNNPNVRSFVVSGLPEKLNHLKFVFGGNGDCDEWTADVLAFSLPHNILTKITCENTPKLHNLTEASISEKTMVWIWGVLRLQIDSLQTVVFGGELMNINKVFALLGTDKESFRNDVVG